MSNPNDLLVLPSTEIQAQSRAELLSSIIGSVATADVRQQLPDVDDRFSARGVRLEFMQIDTVKDRVGVAMQWNGDDSGHLAVNHHDYGHHRFTLTNKPADLARAFARLGVDSGIAVAPLLYSTLSRGAKLPAQQITRAEELGVATVGNWKHGGSMYFVEAGKAVRFDVPTRNLAPTDVDRARSLLHTPRIETLIPAATHVARVEARDISRDCTALTYNGRKGYVYQGQELVLGPRKVELQARIAEGFSLGASEAVVMERAEETFAVADHEALDVISSPVFQATMTTLRSELAELNTTLHEQGKLPDGKTVGVTSVSIDSVGRSEYGDLVSAMVTTVVNNINPRGEVVSVPQKVEFRLHEDHASLRVFDFAGQRYIAVRRDQHGKPILLGESPSPYRDLDANSEDNHSGDPLMYTSFGGGNQRTRLHRSYTDLGGSKSGPGEEVRVSEADVDLARETAPWRKAGNLLTVAEIVWQTNDAVTAAAALGEARPEDAADIAEALKVRQQNIEHNIDAPLRSPQVVIGANLPQDILGFAPFAEILSDYPDAVGVVCDQLTLPKQTQPLLAEVTGVIVPMADGRWRVQTIKPVMARKASVTVGIFQTLPDKGQSMLTVAELRTAVGSVEAEQAVAGSTGDRGGMNFPPIVRDEVHEEAGIDLGPDALQQVAVYKANPHTTEQLGFFVASMGAAVEQAEEGQVHGTDAGERTLVHARHIPDFGSSDEQLPLGRPLDAKTAILAYLGRLHIPEHLARR